MTQNVRLIRILLAVPALLAIPFVAMFFTNEVNWTFLDFVAMGVLLMSTGLACEFILRKIKKLEHRLALCGGVLILLFLVWAELAVGIFGTPFAGS